MGLDMFLDKETYIGAIYDSENITGQIRIKRNGVHIPIVFDKVVSITERVAYWRKANMIHKWFVDNVQGGIDDCGRYRVTVQQLQLLIDICERVLKDHSLAEELLDADFGCFFGSQELDEYYIDDLESTVKQLRPLTVDNDFNVSYYYHASW